MSLGNSTSSPALNSVLGDLGEYFARNQPSVTLAYLFGSRARGVVHSGSDWDFAVELEPGAEPGPWWLSRLIVELGSLVASKQIDVVVLGRATPSVQFAVVREGLPVYERSAGDAVRFRVRAVGQYLDTAPLREARLRFFKELPSEGARNGRP